MSNPRDVFCSANCPSPVSSLKDSGSSRFIGSDGCSGWKSVWTTNRAALFAQSIQCSSSTVMVMMSLIIPYIDASVAVMSTDEVSDVEIWLVDCFLFLLVCLP